MWIFGIIGIVCGIMGLIGYACCVVASRADDMEEQYRSREENDK